MKRKHEQLNHIRTIYDKGSEEIGREQMDWDILGGCPEMLNDGDDIFEFSDSSTINLFADFSKTNREHHHAFEKYKNY